MAKVKSSVVIDGDGSDLNVASFVAAYEEEQRLIKEFNDAKAKAEAEVGLGVRAH